MANKTGALQKWVAAVAAVRGERRRRRGPRRRRHLPGRRPQQGRRRGRHGPAGPGGRRERDARRIPTPSSPCGARASRRTCPSRGPTCPGSRPTACSTSRAAPTAPARAARPCGPSPTPTASSRGGTPSPRSTSARGSRARLPSSRAPTPSCSAGRPPRAPRPAWPAPTWRRRSRSSSWASSGRRSRRSSSSGEVGQQIGYLNAATVGAVNFIILILIGYAFNHKEKVRALVASGGAEGLIPGAGRQPGCRPAPALGAGRAGRSAGAQRESWPSPGSTGPRLTGRPMRCQPSMPPATLPTSSQPCCRR